MKIEISTKNFDLTPSLTTFIEDKMDMISKHVQKFELERELLLRIHVGRITAHHHKGEVYEASADLPLPGTSLHAENTNEDPRAAIDAVREVLDREIRKYKTKHS